MSKKCLAAAALLALTSTAVAQAQPFCSGQPVQYDIAYLGGTDFTVTAEFPASAGLVDLSWRSSESAPDGQAEFISQLELRDLEGSWQAPEFAALLRGKPVLGDGCQISTAYPRSPSINLLHPDGGQGPVHGAATHGNLAPIQFTSSLKLGPDLRQDDAFLGKLIPAPSSLAYASSVPVAREA